MTCPKCGAAMTYERDHHGPYWACLCGNHVEPSKLPLDAVRHLEHGEGRRPRRYEPSRRGRRL